MKEKPWPHSPEKGWLSYEQTGLKKDIEIEERQYSLTQWMDGRKDELPCQDKASQILSVKGPLFICNQFIL